VRLMLISQAVSARPGDRGELSEGGRARVAELGRMLPQPRAAFTSSAVGAVQTAEALGLSAKAIDDLRDWDPAAETVEDLLARVGDWLDGQANASGTRAAVTHGAVIRAAIAVAVGTPSAFDRIDVAPCSVTELSFRERRWRLAHVNWEPALLHIPQRRGRRRPKGPA
jgi:broad specificity phosphatase PhoE